MVEQLPIQKTPSRLIVLWAFDLDDEGGLRPAWDPVEMPDERRAVMRAKSIAGASCRRHRLVARGQSGDG